MSIKAFNVRGDGYAGFRRPGDVVDDPYLSLAEKLETLQHWQQSLMRLARFASASGREAREDVTHEDLTIEVAAAIDRVDSTRFNAPIFKNSLRRFSRG